MLLGPLTVGRKAAAWGYRKYGLPGAVLAGAVGVWGYLALRSAVRDARRDGDGDGDGDGRSNS